jgi:hypothetical protein
VELHGLLVDFMGSFEVLKNSLGEGLFGEMNIGEEVIKHEKERLKKVLKEAETSHNAS